MLKECAPGHQTDETDHFWRIRHDAQTYPSLPKKRTIDVGHVRKMARHLGILECAKRVLGI